MQMRHFSSESRFFVCLSTSDQQRSLPAQDVNPSSDDAQLTVTARPSIQITRVCVHVTVLRVGEQPLQQLDVVEHRACRFWHTVWYLTTSKQSVPGQSVAVSVSPCVVPKEGAHTRSRPGARDACPGVHNRVYLCGEHKVYCERLHVREHHRMRRECKDCGGSAFCQNQSIRLECRDCGGSALCEHQRRRSECTKPKYANRNMPNHCLHHGGGMINVPPGVYARRSSSSALLARSPESEEFFRLTGQLAQPDQGHVFSKRATFSAGIRSKVGKITADGAGRQRGKGGRV